MIGVWRALGLVFAACGATLPLGAASAQDAHPYVATPDRTFTLSTDPGLFMPTGVAVDQDGLVYVADGVHNRIVVFNPDGTLSREITSANGIPLATPVSVRIDELGLIWIADTDNARVVALDSGDRLVHEFTLPAAEGQGVPAITDASVSPDRKSVWVVDNHNHRIARFPLDGGPPHIVGALGESLGQFNYPFSIAISPDGDLHVSEAINARIQTLTPEGRPAGSVGTFGVDLGNLYRPKSLAIGADKNLWVVDGTLQVIQIFRPNGGFIDVLRDDGGNPLKFEAPCGIAIDSEGRVYVTELPASRVVSYTVRRDEAAAALARIRQAQPAALIQPRSCAVCHLEWVQPLARGESTPLMDPPDTSREHPSVSRQEACLSCHDGSVDDSRRRVWEEHGHRSGIEPPATMTVPAHLPLDAGKLACRTCHSAHGAGTPTADLRSAVMLRVPNTASELCISCHVDKTRGPRFGTHPTGGMPWPVPDKLRAAGAKTGPNPRELTCQVCHTPHGAKNDHLLVLGTSSNQLCVTCHDQMRPGMFRDGAHAEHPLSATVNAEQAAAVKDLGTKLSPDNKLICLSCHKLHHGFGERFLLADELSDGQMCIRCHSERKEMLGTVHDLRTNFPEERNRLGLTPNQGGPCSSCHLFHRFARPTTPGPGDAAGQCITCHSDGQCAQNKQLGDVNHPALNCTACHNPHQTRFGSFLAAEPATLCSQCHQDQAQLVSGPHDECSNSGAWPLQSQQKNDRCLACHRPHGNQETGLFRMGLAASTTGPDAACLACHPQSAWRTDSPTAAMHSRLAIGSDLAPDLPYVHSKEGAVQIGCRTCHDPHAGPGKVNLLRVEDGRSGDELCMKCHCETRFIEATPHSEPGLRTAGLNSTACQPCHSVHANPAELEPTLLWRTSLLLPYEAPVGNGNDELAPLPGSERCGGCHHEGGVASAPLAYTHPDVPFFDPFSPEDPGFVPLYDDHGRRDMFGRISCGTCHLPHGRAVSEDVLNDATNFNEEVRARRMLLRPFTSDNVCTTCHGFDSLRRFLVFHKPDRRTGGTLSGDTPPTPPTR